MLKISKGWILFSMILWLVCCQGLFVLIQSSFGLKIIQTTQTQLRQELDFSNYHFLARSITDSTTSGSIRCAVLEKISPENTLIIDLKYMGQGCDVRPWELKGEKFKVNLKSLNGDVYRFQFISNNPFLFDLALWGFRILGLIAILAIMMAIKSIAERKLIAYQAEVEVAQKVKAIAMQVSHDIRSPLSALKMAIKDEVSVKDNVVIASSLDRISDIANDLLNSEKKIAENKMEIELIGPIIDSVILEKQTQFKDLKGVSIQLEQIQNKDFYVRINQREFKRVLSNLINNSVEALNEKGHVLLKITEEDKFLVLSIKDNGKGIPAKILEQIGTAGFSHEKQGESGSGLGVFHAKETIKSVGGDFQIISQEGIGTEILIKLLIVDSKVLGVQKTHYDYVYIDDDKILRLGWEKRAKKENVSLLSLKSTEEFESHLANISKDHSRIYIDSDLGEGKMRGEEFAKLLRDRGFKNLFLATGFEPESFEQQEWLTIRGKECPF